MKKIEDYLKHYIGCDVIHSDGSTSKLIGVQHPDTINIVHNDYGVYGEGKYGSVKLLLRPLSSMTKEEAIMLADIIHPESKGNHPDDVINDPDLLPSVTRNLTTNRAKFYASVSFEMTRFLLSKSFDLFGLIDANLALDSTKIEKV